MLVVAAEATAVSVFGDRRRRRPGSPPDRAFRRSRPEVAVDASRSARPARRSRQRSARRCRRRSYSESAPRHRRGAVVADLAEDVVVADEASPRAGLLQLSPLTESALATASIVSFPSSSPNIECRRRAAFGSEGDVPFGLGVEHHVAHAAEDDVFALAADRVVAAVAEDHVTAGARTMTLFPGVPMRTIAAVAAGDRRREARARRDDRDVVHVPERRHSRWGLEEGPRDPDADLVSPPPTAAPSSRCSAKRRTTFGAQIPNARLAYDSTVDEQLEPAASRCSASAYVLDRGGVRRDLNTPCGVVTDWKMPPSPRGPRCELDLPPPRTAPRATCRIRVVSNVTTAGVPIVPFAVVTVVRAGQVAGPGSRRWRRWVRPTPRQRRAQP